MKWSFFGVEPQIGELSGQPLENFPQRPTMPQILRFDKYVLCVASSHPFLPRKGCDVTRINFGIFRHDLHGSLAKEFSELRALEKLDLRDNNITGDLHVLKQNTLLRDLDLDNTRISGDLQSLAKATKLERLYLRGTQVYGDVVALSNAKDLRRLHLTETKVHGDVVALKNAKGLWHLDLAETRVHGDLASLANLTKLENLQLSNTKVSGDLSAMLHWEKIERLGLSGTKVSGHPTEDFKDCCKNLWTLELAWTNVRIMDGFLEDFEPHNESTHEWICPFPALTSFNITGNSLNITVRKLFKPFFGCSMLRAFGAAACSLTGKLPVMRAFPLGRVLQLLDLSSNNVTKVEALPRNVRHLMLRENPSISFEEDVVKMATQEFVSVDLRNATFADPRDTKLTSDLTFL